MLKARLTGLLPRRTHRGAANGHVPVPVTVRTTTPERIVFPLRVEARVGQPLALRACPTGTERYERWRIDGPLPKGLAFDSATGTLAGTPSDAGLTADITLTGFGRDRYGRARFAVEVRA